MAYLLSGNMDKGSVEYQLEAAISKIFASVSVYITQLFSSVFVCGCAFSIGYSVATQPVDICPKFTVGLW